MAKRTGSGSKDRSRLRRRAEASLQGQESDVHALSSEEAQRLVHELEVHQIELEMQNAELREGQEKLEASRDRYADLYDFAPLGYTTLDAQGIIREINLTVASLLGRERSRLVGRRFASYVVKEDKSTFLKRLGECLRRNERVTFEASLAPKDRPPLCVQFDVVPTEGPNGNRTLCRAAITDITERKRAEQTLQQALQQSRRRQAEVTALLEGARAVLEYRQFREAARSIFDSCKKLIGATGGYVALLSADRSENEVVFLDSGGLDCHVDLSAPMPVRGLRGEVYRTGEAVYENDFSGSRWMQFIPQGHARLENVLFAPLSVGGEVVGLLGIANKPGGFDDHDARVASAFGELAAVALLNSRTLESLEQSEQRFRAVAQSAHDGIISVDGSGKIIFWNAAATKMFSYSADEVLGKPLTMLMPERFREAHQKALARILSSGESRIGGKTLEVVGRRRDGSELPIELSLGTWTTKQGGFVTGVLRDVTDRKAAEEEIAKLAKFPGENPNPVLRFSSEGVVLYANRASAPLLELWQCREGEVLCENWRRFVFDALETGRSHQTEVECDDRVFALTFTPITDLNYVNAYAADVTRRKRTEAALLTARDDLERRVDQRTAELTKANVQLTEQIEERARAERALRRSQERLRRNEARLKSAQHVARLGFWDWNIATDDLYWSDEIYEIFGLRPREFGDTYGAFLGVVHPDDRGLVERHVKAALEDDVEYSIDHRIVLPDGQVRYVHEQGAVTRNADGKPVHMLGTVIDITERKQLENEILQISSQEHQRIGQELHDGLSQELLGLGMMAKSLQQTLQVKSLPEADLAREITEALIDAQTHVRAMIKGLHPVEVDADGLMAALSDLAASTELLADLPCTFVCGQPVPVEDNYTATQLFYIASEAVRNAVKHAKAKHVAVGLGCEEDKLTLWVRDDGVGIQGDPQRIAGMGLRIMQHRAKTVGASLEIRASDGTLVTCTLRQD